MLKSAFMVGGPLDGKTINVKSHIETIPYQDYINDRLINYRYRRVQLGVDINIFIDESISRNELMGILIDAYKKVKTVDVSTEKEESRQQSVA